MANTPFEDRLKQSGVLPQTTGAPVAQPTGGGPIASKFQQQGYLPQAPAPEVQPEGPGVADYLSVGIRGLAEAVPATAAGIASAIQGQAGVEAPGQEDIIEKGIRAESRRLTEFEQEVARKYPESTAIQTLSRLPRQLGFSLPSTAAGIAAGAAAAPAATVPGGQAVPFVAGGATAGAVAYRSASADIMRSYIDTLDEQKRSELGHGLTREETEAAKTSFESKATEYGLWEALPEAAGGALAGRLVFGPLKKMVGEKLAGTMLGKLGSAAGVVAEELGTETITQIGQSRTLAGTPLSEAQVLEVPLMPALEIRVVGVQVLGSR